MSHRYNHYNQRYDRPSRPGELWKREQLFRCIRCGLDITCNSLISGVQNRNHCPYCLWSRHLDAHLAGDRLSGCHAAMQPVGLTTKHSRNKYAHDRDGELMLIHQCSQCRKLVINRIAADDSVSELLALFERSCEPSAVLAADLSRASIVLLTALDRDLVQQQLLGHIRV